LLIAATWAWTHRSRPVLFELLHETNCACGNFHEEISGLTWLNPFRERSPEYAADHFFEELEKKNCPDNTTEGICHYALEEVRPVIKWKLRNRKESVGRVSLYYSLRGRYRPDHDLYPHDSWGEGMVEVQRSGDKWRVTGYGAYY
jgi:hypothetical protein